MNYLGYFFIHLKLELLTQLPLQNEKLILEQQSTAQRNTAYIHNSLFIIWGTKGLQNAVVASGHSTIKSQTPPTVIKHNTVWFSYWTSPWEHILEWHLWVNNSISSKSPSAIIQSNGCQSGVGFKTYCCVTVGTEKLLIPMPYFSYWHERPLTRATSKLIYHSPVIRIV